MAKVSIVIPIYNVEKYLRKCLETIQNQTFKDIEVICVNDGTKDNSQDIVDEFVAKDSRFKSLIKQNGGLSDARNYGLPHCTGEYLLFVDSDDFLESETVVIAYNRAIKDNLDIVVFDFNEYYSLTGQKIIYSNNFDENKVYSLKDTPSLLCYVKNAAWNKLYKRSLFTEHNIYYPKGLNQEDLGTTPKLLLFAERIGFVKKSLYNYLIDRPNNITQQVDHRIYQILDIIKLITDFYKEQNCFDTYYEELKYLCGINFLSFAKKLPQYQDIDFVMKYIDDSFHVIRSIFKDFPQGKYNLCTYKEDKIYLNPVLLKMYIRYRVIKNKFTHKEAK